MLRTLRHWHGFMTFNRTSMESKLHQRACRWGSWKSFNRTSMESKHNSMSTSSPATSMLLIEPVWNRNTETTLHLLAVKPPFNRTSMESKPNLGKRADVPTDTLLIEPVWNRNQGDDGR